MTDIANEPDDQMSLVRFLVYSNGFDVEGIVATTSTWMKRAVRPDVILTVLDAYEKVQPNLLKHAAARDDPRPLWVLGWGGMNTLAQALFDVRATRTPRGEALVGKLRVYAISDQDDAGPWLRREFPALHYVATPTRDDLALAHGLPARLRGAYGVDGRGAARRQPQSDGDRERKPRPGAARAGGDRPPELPPRVVIEDAASPRATVVPKLEGIAQVILAVEDGGSPSLTSYRRVIVSVKAADAGGAR
jgi:hypothetical protein